MREHGWQLPHHPLQVVAVAVFLALAIAFYVFFAPFVGKKLFQYIVMGLYSPLLLSVFGLYMWCAAADPADGGVYKSKKYLHTSSSWLLRAMCFPCSLLFKRNNPSQGSSDRRTREDGMFYCSLCEVEVSKCSKHCRVCDKCVAGFDHHCRWLNNCIGKKNYRKFFTLMVFTLLLLILQWLTGILALISCFHDRKRFSADIASKLGNSFTIVPYVIVVVVCTILAMLATLPLAQLFSFHILLIKKGLSTYDYIIALREQEQQAGANGGQQSPQMSQVSSLTGLSSVSSFNTFQRGAFCTPPRLFMEDQFDVVPPDTGSMSLYGNRATMEEPTMKKNPAVKISPWTLARLSGEEVSKAAAEARNKSKILQPVSSGQSKRMRLQDEALSNRRASNLAMANFQIEPRSGFQSHVIIGSSPESSLDSPDLHPFWVSSSGGEESSRLTGLEGGSGSRRLTGGDDGDRYESAIVTLKASSSSSFSKTSNRNN